MKSEGKLIRLLFWGKIIKLWEKRIFYKCELCRSQISSAVQCWVSSIMIIWTSWNRHLKTILMRISIWWNILSRAALASVAWPVLGVAITASNWKWTRKREAWAFMAFLSHSISVYCKEEALLVKDDEKTCFVQTQVRLDFIWFQLEVQIRACWFTQGKEKDVLKQVQELFFLRELVVSSNPRSEPVTAKKPFLVESLCGLRESFLKVTFWHFEETAILDISWY